MEHQNFSRKTLWRLDDSIKYGGSFINRGAASLKIKKAFNNNRCTEFQWKELELLEEIHKHTHNSYEITLNQMEIIESLNRHYDLNLIIVPVWMNLRTFSKDVYLEYQRAISRIRNELMEKQIKFDILNLEEDVSNYDEPWCMCGHLSPKGRDELMHHIRAAIN